MADKRAIHTDLGELLREEQELTATAGARLGSYADLALAAFDLLTSSITSIDSRRFLFSGIHHALQKFAILAMLSYIRKHTAQADFNCRQIAEFGGLSAYALVHPEVEITRENGELRPDRELRDKANQWISENFPTHSAYLKEIKSQINGSTSHASIYVAHFNFELESDEDDIFYGSFFDRVEPEISQLYLMRLSRLLVVIVDLIWKTSVKHGGVVLRTDIRSQIEYLELAVERHRLALAHLWAPEPEST